MATNKKEAATAAKDTKAQPSKAQPSKAQPSKAQPSKETAVATRPKADVGVAANLAAKAADAAKREHATRAEDGANINYISLAQALTKALDETENKLYIEGLELRDFFIQNQKLNLGKKFRCVPLLFLTVYNEYDGPSQKAKFVGIWHKDDALQYGLVPGSYFNRQLPNGHELRPVKWVIVYLPDHPDITNVVITFRSTGNRIAKDWAKDIEGKGLTSFQCVYSMTSVKAKNENGDSWWAMQPEFVGTVYDIDKKGAVVVNEDYAETVIDASAGYSKAYVEGTLVSRRSAAATRTVSVEDDDVFDDEEDDDVAF